MTSRRAIAARAATTTAFAIAGLLLATSAQAADRHVRIINETRHTMVHFYASNTAANTWEEDILGRSVLPAGQDVNINIDDGTGHCHFDFKAVFDDGDSVVKHDIDVCKITFYRYTE